LSANNPATRKMKPAGPSWGRPAVSSTAALKQAEIDRNDVFVTNAVKHFKHEMRGKRRLHKRPNAYEIKRCRWWLEQGAPSSNPRLSLRLAQPQRAPFCNAALQSAKREAVRTF
jgi:uracil-DNA glycosylase